MLFISKFNTKNRVGAQIWLPKITLQLIVSMVQIIFRKYRYNFVQFFYCTVYMCSYVYNFCKFNVVLINILFNIFCIVERLIFTVQGAQHSYLPVKASASRRGARKQTSCSSAAGDQRMSIYWFIREHNGAITAVKGN